MRATKWFFAKTVFGAMKRFILPALLLLHCHLFAQLEHILEDPSVNWAAEFEIILPADPLAFATHEDRSASIAVLKITSEYESSLHNYVNHSLSAILWEIAENEEWDVFANAELTRPVDSEELMQMLSGPDTIVRFDPSTYEEKVQIAWDMRSSPQDARFVKVRQLLTYNDEAARFHVHTLAIAPVARNEVPRFWLKVPETEDFRPDTLIANAEVTWAARYVTNVSSPRISDFQVLKDDTDMPIMERFFYRIMADTSVLLYGGLLDEAPLPPDRRACLFSCMDSVSTFDPETYLEHVEVFHTELMPEQIIDLQMIQEFFWHDEDGLLYTRLVAVAPRYKFYYREGQWYPRVGFLLRCDE